MPELKPCPFCGGEAKLTKLSVSYNAGYPIYNGIALVVKCGNCGCFSPYKRGTIHGNFRQNEEDKAIEAWNRRASDERSDFEKCAAGRV